MFKDEIGRKCGVESKKVVRTFAWASFLNDMGSDMIYPIWPLFVTVFLNANMAVLGFILYGLHKGALEPVQRAFVSELAPEDFRASTLGAYQMVTGLCALPASLSAGFLWDKLGIFTPLYFSLGLTVLSIILLTFVRE